jgi:hypothetical protein
MVNLPFYLHDDGELRHEFHLNKDEHGNVRLEIIVVDDDRRRVYDIGMSPTMFKYFQRYVDET